MKRALAFALFMATALWVCTTTPARAFEWEPVPGARPCTQQEIKWVVKPWPIESGTGAYVVWETCTIISGYTEEEAKRAHADGSGLTSSESLRDHEYRHLLHALRHPVPRVLDNNRSTTNAGGFAWPAPIGN